MKTFKQVKGGASRGLEGLSIEITDPIAALDLAEFLIRSATCEMRNEDKLGISCLLYGELVDEE